MTWGDILEIAFGTMGLDPAVFWRMSWRDFQLAQRGFFESKKGDIQREWEIARWQSYVSLMPYDSKKRLHSPKDIMVFPWEKPEDVQLFEGDELKWFANKFGHYYKDGKFVN